MHFVGVVCRIRQIVGMGKEDVDTTSVTDRLQMGLRHATSCTPVTSLVRTTYIWLFFITCSAKLYSLGEQRSAVDGRASQREKIQRIEVASISLCTMLPTTGNGQVVCY